MLHYFTHQHADREAETFWSGLGAVRRKDFLAVGGYDPNWENIEDVEFGLRLRHAGGRIRLEPLAQGTHLKKLSLGSMFRIDLWGRAVPWTRLIIQGRMRPGLLNSGLRHRLSAAIVALFLAAISIVTFWPQVLWVVPAIIVLFV